MALPPLVTAADLAALLGRSFTPDQEAQAEALLAQASAIVRAYVRQDLTLATTADGFRLSRLDHQLPFGCGGFVLLPQRPIVEVTEVKVNGLLTHDWWLDEDRLLVRSAPWLYPPAAHGPPTVTVTYAHGWDPIPADIQAVVTQAVQRVLVNPDQVRSETVGGESVTYLFPSTGEALGLLLSRVEKKALDRYKRTSGTVRVSPS